MLFSEHMIGSMVDCMPVAWWASDALGRVVHVNQTWLEFTGREADEELGEGWTHGIHEDDLPAVLATWKHAVESHRPFMASYRQRRHDGACRWLKTTGTPCFDDNKALTGYVGVFLDQTERREALQRAERSECDLREAQEALEETDERFKSLLNALPCHVYELANDGRIRWVNDHWLEYSGLTVEETKESGGEASIHPDDLAEVKRRRAERGSTGQPFESEMRIRRHDGAYRWHLARTVPVKVNDRLTGWVGTNVDIDDRKRREIAAEFLVDASHLLSQTLDLGATLTSITRLAVPRLADWCKIDLVDEKGVARVAYSNADPRRMAMAAEAEATLSGVRRDESAQRVARTGQSEIVEHAEPLIATFLAERPDLEGVLTAFDFRSSIVVPIKTERRTIGALTLVTAESGRRLSREDLPLAEEFASRFAMAIENALLYDTLTAALQAKDEFLALVSHELRTPLTTLTGTARALRRHGDRISPPERAVALRDVEVGAESLARIVENMLTLAQADSRSTVELEPQLLRRLIGAMLVEQREQFPSHEVILTEVETLLPVTANADYVRLIVGNLLSNARKYSPSGGRIDVLIDRDGDFAAVTVSDRGIGLKQEQLADVFEPFFRSQEGAAHASGIGLGLTVCKRFVELQGGTISAAARPGGGSSFRFTLPLAIDEMEGE